MLTAFTPSSIKELGARDRSKHEVILACGDKLLVGLNNGTLRIYRAPPDGASNPTITAAAAAAAAAGDSSSSASPTRSKQQAPKMECLRELENFTKRQITQMDCIESVNVIVVLADGHVSLYDMKTYELIEQLSRTKGASLFAVTTRLERDSSGIPVTVSRLAVAIKRKLVLFRWKEGELQEPGEITLSSSPRYLTWVGEGKLCTGLASTFAIVDIYSEAIKEAQVPSVTGSAAGAAGSYLSWGARIPIATPLSSNEILVTRDYASAYVNLECEQIEGKQTVSWQSAPETIGFSFPYLVCLLPKSVIEIRNPQTQTILQSFNLPNATSVHIPTPKPSLSHYVPRFYVLSPTQLWKLDLKSFEGQIDELCAQNKHDEAISILEQLDPLSIDSKERRLKEVRMLKAEKLFEAGRYRPAMDLFAEVSAPPERVIRLYPPQIAGELSRYAVPDASPEGENTLDAEGEAVNGDAEDDSDKKSDTVIKDAGGQSGPSSTTGSGPRKLNSSVNGKVPESPSRSTLNVDEKMEEKTPKPLEGKAFKVAVGELSAYLADMRRRLSKFVKPDTDVESYPELEELVVPTFGDGDSRANILNDASEVAALLFDKASDSPREQMMQLYRMAQLVDDTMLRAYMLTNTSLVKHFVRIENFCDPKIVHEKLVQTGRFKELIDYLWNKKLYKEALLLLKELGDRDDPDDREPELHGATPTIGFLQKLDAEELPLILEFSTWVLEKDPHAAIQIFIDDSPQSESLPRTDVLHFLEKISISMGVQYVEHLIHGLNDDSPDLHNWLIGGYMDLLMEKRDDNENSDWEWKLSPEKRDELVKKLLSFLEESKQYWPEKVLGWLPNNDPVFYEARALTLGKMGRHRTALEIYVFKLLDHERAEEYCNRVHLSEPAAPSPQITREGSPSRNQEPESVYYTLLSLYLNPPEPHSVQIGPAVALLSRHGARLEPSDTLKLIPESLKVGDLYDYFRSRIRSTNETLNASRIMVQLRKSDLLNSGERLIDERSKHVVIPEERVCPACHKRLGRTSTIAVLPDGRVIHYGCANQVGVKLTQEDPKQRWSRWG